ncbi:uncharacterized protein [Trachinotus anak]|uniref:uncharacterized protein isoform X2 n=1 Tax=Trachinotus anak TaxID=443729 RepID=UPI0039F1A7B0
MLQSYTARSTGLASAIGAFCIALLSGAAGGLLLGGTAVVVLQSLELLADNRLLVDQLENYIRDYPLKENKISRPERWKDLRIEEAETFAGICLTMDQSDTDQPNQQMPRVTEDCSRVNRSIRLPSCVTSGLASAIGAFCIGLLSGAAGGLLLGGTAVVVLQSLELLADNRLLVDQLENYIRDYPLKENVGILQRTSNDHMLNTYISLLVEEFGVFSSTLSLAAGICCGLSTYALVTKKYGEAAMGKALVLAGPVCLMGVTATGYILGSALGSFLSITFSLKLFMWFLINYLLFFLFVFCLVPILACFDYNYITPFTVWLLTPATVMTIALIHLYLTTKLILMVALFPTIWGVILLGNTYDFKLTTASVPLMLFITDVFNIARQPIVSLQSPASTNTSSAVLEGMFVGVLTPQLWTAAIGTSLFVSWQKGGARTICASAAGSGAAVLGAIKAALPVLGPGPTIGALMGLAGAVGVSLAAGAAAAADHYGLWGRLGVTVGAAVGAFLSSCAHSGLSGMFMGLCAATIPAGLYFMPLFLFLWQKFKFCICIIITVIVLIWLCFTATLGSAVSFSVSIILLLLLIIFFGCIRAFNFIRSKFNQ